MSNGERTPKAKPRAGTICPWMREAAMLSGSGATKKHCLCDPDCAMFGEYYAAEKLTVKATGCRRTRQ